MTHVVFVDDAHTYGGAQIAFANGLRSLSIFSSYKITVLLANENQQLNDIIKNIPNINLIPCPTSRPFNVIFFILSLYGWKKTLDLIDVESVDCWVINLPGIEFGLACSIILNHRNVMPIGWLHLGSSFSELMPEAKLLRRLGNLIRDQLSNKFIFGLYNKILVPTAAAKTVVLKRLSVNKKLPEVDVLGNVNFNKTISFVDHSTTEGGCSLTNNIKISVVGRIQFWDKGQDKTAAIAIELWKCGFEPRFVFVGDGVDEDDLVSLFESNGILGSIEVTGWTDDVSKYLYNTDIVLIPSRIESFCLVALEAMQYGCRIVASPLPCFDEVLPGVCIVEMDSPECYAQKIKEILKYKLDDLKVMYTPFLKKFSPESFTKSFSRSIACV